MIQAPRLRLVAPPLGPRLETMLALVPETSRCIADIGTDHAHLAIALARRGQRVIATDRSAEAARAAAARVRARGLGQRIEVRHGDGFDPLGPSEVNTVVIGGMGRGSIQRILEAGLPRVTGIRRLVLQPSNEAPLLRRFLADAGWHLVDERLAREARSFVCVLAAEPGGSAAAEGARSEHDDELDRLFGPIIRTRPDPLFREWLEHERRRVDRSVTSAERTHGADARLARRSAAPPEARRRSRAEQLVRFREALEHEIARLREGRA